MRFIFHQPNQHDQDEMKEFEQSLTSLVHKNVRFDPRRRDLLKHRLISKIHGTVPLPTLQDELDRLGQSVQQVASAVQLSARFKVILKERIFHNLDRTRAMELAFGSHHRPAYLRLLLSALTIFCLVVTTVFWLPLRAPMVLAAESTYIAEIHGQVFVLRNGQSYPAHQNFSLQEGDALLTQEQSFVTIRFFDDSTSRLGQNSRLELKRLYTEPFYHISTQVEVLLNEGRLWTRVLNLVDEHSRFTVDTDQAFITATKKAAFDVQTSPAHSTLAVFDNVVDFSSRHQLNAQAQSVVAGFQAEVTTSGMSTKVIAPTVQAAIADADPNLWIQSNLQRDEAHTEQIVSEKENQLNNTDQNQPAAGTMMNRDERVFAQNELEQERVGFIDDYRTLLRGEKLLVRYQVQEGMKEILRFQSGVRTFMIHFADLQKKDPANAVLLQSLIEGKIAEQRKDMATFLPGDALYPAKEVLEETELYLFPNEVDKTLHRLTQAQDKLLEVQDLVKKGNFDIADRLLVRYAYQMDLLALKLNDENIAQLQEKLTSIFANQVDQIKGLTVVEASLHDVPQGAALLTAVQKVRSYVLDRLIVAFQSLPEAVPPRLLRELKDLLQTYLNETVRDEIFIGKLNRLLVAYGEKDLMSQFKLPDRLGVITIVEDQATKPPETKE